MVSLFQRLDEEEAIVRGELDALREKIAVTEERLARLTITRETARQLLGPDEETLPEQAAPAESEPETPAQAPEQPGRRLDALDAKLAELKNSFAERDPQPAAAVGTPKRVEWAEGLRLIEQLLATSGRVMRAQEITAAIGEVGTPARVETTRGRCKHLVKTGKLVELEPGRFQIAAGSAAGSGEAPSRK